MATVSEVVDKKCEVKDTSITHCDGPSSIPSVPSEAGVNLFLPSPGQAGGASKYHPPAWFEFHEQQ